MIKSILICTNAGHPFYSRAIDGNEFAGAQPELLSGLISAIGMIGKDLFDQEIATISFGVGDSAEKNHIVIISKEDISEHKITYFVFNTEGDCESKFFRELATGIFIEIKTLLNANSSDQQIEKIRERTDALIDNKYHGLREC